MSQQKDEGFFKNLPLPKASTIPRARESLPVETSAIVNECLTIIRDYRLEELVIKAKESGFEILSEDEKELLSAGIIKIGEAMTFCRDSDNSLLRGTSIIKLAKDCAAARNYFVHHQMYHSHLGLHNKARSCIESLPLMNVLIRKLQGLQTCGLDALTKSIMKGQNDFPFKYSVFVECLNTEFLKLKSILVTDNLLDVINSNVALRATLENRIRNVLSIIVDLTDKDSCNKNLGEMCLAEKAVILKINKVFCSEFEDFSDFFNNLHEFRNSLCHIDDSLERPYKNARDMIVFARQLDRMYALGYVDRLDRQLQVLQDEKTSKQVEVEAHTESHDSASSSSSGVKQALSSQTEDVKRKVIATPAAQTAKAAATAATSERSHSLVSDVYNSDSDDESMKASNDQIQTDRPKMGRR